MNRYLCVIFLFLVLAAPTQAQGSSCTVSGYLHHFDGTAAANATLTVVKIEEAGIVTSSGPTDYVSDGTGFISFAVPANSEAWLQANNVAGFNTLGGVPVLIPGDATAALELLWQLDDGVTSFNARAGDISLSSSDVNTALGYVPANSSGLVAALNNSAEGLRISDGLLSNNVPRLDTANSFQFSIASPALYGGTTSSSTLTLAGNHSGTAGTANIFLNGNGEGNVLIGTTVNPTSTALDPSARLLVTGAGLSNTAAVRINGGAGSSSVLDIFSYGYTAGKDGKAMRFFDDHPFPAGVNFEPRSYFNTQGAYYSNAWMVISGQTAGTGDNYNIRPPTGDPFMLGIWSDIAAGPAMQVRGSSGKSNGSYLFSGIDTGGSYTFSIEEDGELKWGAPFFIDPNTNAKKPGSANHAALDTNLYRSAPGVLQTDADFAAGGERQLKLIQRNLPLTVGNAVDIGSFNLTNGTANISIAVVVASGGYSVAKTYLLPVQYNQPPAATWLKALPTADTGPYGGNNFDLDVNVNKSVVAFRLRTTATDGSHSGVARISINQGGVTTDSFTPSLAVTTVSAPTQTFGASRPTVQTSGLVVQSSNNSTVPAVVAGASGQSSDLQQWQDSTGRTLLSITPTGQIRIPTTLPGTAPFAIDYRNVPDGFGTFDPILTFGYNQTANGGKIQSGENGLSWSVEGDYYDGTPNHKMESYLQYSSKDGSQVIRPLFFQLDKVTNRLVASYIEGNPLVITDDFLNLSAQFSPGLAKISPALSGDTSFLVQAGPTATSRLFLGYRGTDSYLSIVPDAKAARVTLNGHNVMNVYHSPAGQSGSAIAVGADDSSAVGLFAVGASSSALKGIAVRGNAGQTGNLQEWQNSTGSALSVINAAGRMGVGTNAPSSDAAIDVNGGNTQGLRIRPRTSPGAPSSGTWSVGTMIVDSNGSLYICTASGAPGSWQKVGAQ